MANEELDKRVYVKELYHKLKGLKQIVGDEASLDRWIIVPDVNRPGLELTGYYEDADLKRVVILGSKEIRYIRTLPEDIQRNRFEFLTDPYTPCIILSKNYDCPPILKEIAEYKNFPIFSFPDYTYNLVVDVVSFLSEKLAPTESKHGVMLSIYGIGVMITGDSGIGKSELALDLINRGHLFVADDVVEVSRVHNDILATAPELLKKMLEIRGLGIVDVNHMFGGNSYLEKSKLDLIIHLVELKDFNELDRLNPSEKTINFFGIDVPLIEVPVTPGKSMSVIIESAVTNYLVKKDGYNSTEEFKNRIYNAIQIKNERR